MRALLILVVVALMGQSCEPPQPLPMKLVIVTQADSPVEAEFVPPFGEAPSVLLTGLVEGDCLRMRTLYRRVRFCYPTSPRVCGGFVTMASPDQEEELRCLRFFDV